MADLIDSPTTDAPATDSGSIPAETPSFADGLRDANPAFSQADLDAKLAESRKAWDTEHEQKFGWAKDLTAESYQKQADIAARAQSDPLGYAQDLMRQAAANPQFAPALHAMRQRVLAGSPAATAAHSTAVPASEPGPDLRVQNPDGSITQLYSAERMAEREAWRQSQFDAKLDERLKPLDEFHQQTQAEREAQQAQQQQFQTAGTIVQTMRQQPGFTDHEADIQAAFRKMGTFTSDTDAINGLWSAYVQTVMPKVTAQGATDAIQQEARKVAANTARPSGSQAATPKPNDNFRDNLADEFARRRRGA